MLKPHQTIYEVIKKYSGNIYETYHDIFDEEAIYDIEVKEQTQITGKHVVTNDFKSSNSKRGRPLLGLIRPALSQIAYNTL